MDFLSIRKKARERAQARQADAASSPAERPAPPPEPDRAPAPPTASGPAEPERAAPVERGSPAAPSQTPEPFARRRRGTDAVLSEEELQGGVLQERYRGLAPSTDGRFATWRPGAGPPPLEPDDRGLALPEPAGDEPTPERIEELELDPLPEAPAPGRAAVARARPLAPPPDDPLDLFFYRPDEEEGLVPALGGGSAEEPVARGPEALDEFLTFRLGKEEYAVSIGDVREVMRAPAITEVPRAPAHVLGVVTVRGEVVAVLDARGRLGLSGGDSGGGRIVIVDAGQGPLGLLVDGVTSVVRLPRGAVEPCPQGISAGASDCVTGIGRQRDRIFMVLDASALLPGAREPERRP